MAPESWVEFPPFRLDLVNHELWRGSELLPLRPKPFAVLAYLATHPQRLILRDELVRAVWPDTHVGEGLLRGYVRDLRAALADDAESPRFIQTIARRGYRFIGQVRRAVEPVAAAVATDAPLELPRSDFVGRASELDHLERSLTTALAGARQIRFVTGEPGIGKTALLDRFVARVRERSLWTVRGQCVEHFGSGEPYLPMLDALAELSRSPLSREVTDILARHAPTWLVQMPSLTEDAELEGLQRRVQGATRERMVRELAAAIEILTAVQPLVLVIEDLQWCDPSTLDLISVLARRRERARLLFVGTYRPADVIASGHPLATLKRELQSHAQCERLALEPLGVGDIGEYLAQRFPRRRFPDDFASSVHRATEGNPLFVVNVVDYWIARAVLVKEQEQWTLAPAGVESVVPDTLRQMIERHVDALPPEARRVLEVAAVVGREFSSAPVAAALEETEARIDEICEGLAAQKHFLSVTGVEALASGGVAGRYRFLHGLYPQVIYDRLPAARRARLHRSVGERQEAAFGARVREHAAELALHFERGHDFSGAVRHLRSAADNAMRKHAYLEAAELLERALALFDGLPDPEKDPRAELSLRMAFATPLLMTKGYAAPEVERVYARAYELSRHMQDSTELVFSLTGLFRFFFGRGRFDPAREIAGQVLRLAEAHDPSLLPVAHSMAGLPLLSLADLAGAREHLERGIALYDFDRHRSIAPLHGDDPGLTSLAFLAIALWYLGYPDRALERSREGQRLAQRLGAPYGIAFAHTFSAWVHVRRGEADRALACCDALMAIALEQGFDFFRAEGAIYRGWALAQRGDTEAGIEHMRQGLAAHRAVGADMGRPAHLALLAEVYGKAEQADEGLRVLEEAFAAVAQTGECTDQAELYRLQGELLHQASGRTHTKDPAEDEAQQRVRQALDIARRQGARSLELKAASSLLLLSRTQKEQTAARQVLSGVLASFNEGSECADVLAARRLLAGESISGG